MPTQRKQHFDLAIESMTCRFIANTANLKFELTNYNCNSVVHVCVLVCTLTLYVCACVVIDSACIREDSACVSFHL